MRVICISDTHTKHREMELYNPLPQGDVLIHAGDLSNRGSQRDVEEFIEWFGGLEGFKNKIFIAGNHDFSFENASGVRSNIIDPYQWFRDIINEEYLSKLGIVYLEDSGFLINDERFSRPIKIWGSPWQPEFYNWAFNLPRNGEELKEKWDLIPNDTDVLITHGPPYDCRDFVPPSYGGEKVGCELLRKRVDEVKPSLHVFGHIHYAYGSAYIGDTLFVNASVCTERYDPWNKPQVVELTEYDGEIVAVYVENN
jgi:Icc-related predicted phosphoesterase